MASFFSIYLINPRKIFLLTKQVTNSLAALARSLVYCTEPFRISYAGKLHALCFDKTGTLTKDQMNLKGVVAGSDRAVLGDFGVGVETFSVAADHGSQSVSEIIMPSFTSTLVQTVLGCCHDLLPPKNSADELVGESRVRL